VIDCHAHLQSVAFDRDLPEVLQRAHAAGVERVLVPGWDLASSGAAIALVSERLGAPEGIQMSAAAGIHPHNAAEADEAAWSEVVAMAEGSAVTAIGETGLDYDRMRSPRDVQLENLRRHLGLALVLGKPLILHCRSAAGRRDAHDDLLTELGAAGFGGPRGSVAFDGRPPAVLHSFSGPLDYAETALRLGLAISFSGLVFRAGEEESAEVARAVPGDRLLVETDCPFLGPPGGPKRNEPAFVRRTAEWLADQRGVELAALEGDLVANYRRIFVSLTRA
jgi:TatD DNase family protein